MCAKKFILRIYGIYPIVSLILCDSDFSIYSCEFSKFLDIIIHFLITYDWKDLVAFKDYIFVFFEDCSAMAIQLNNKAISSLDSSHLDMIFLDIASPEVCDIGITQSGVAAKYQNITDSFKILLCFRYLKRLDFI